MLTISGNKKQPISMVLMGIVIAKTFTTLIVLDFDLAF